MSTPDLSIVIPTCNRAAHLERLLAAIWNGVDCAYEVIVVDGASDDHTPAVLRDAKDSLGDSLRIIPEDRREGFVRAANKGFRAASGRNVTWCNDDARPLDGSLDSAVAPRGVEDELVPEHPAQPPGYGSHALLGDDQPRPAGGRLGVDRAHPADLRDCVRGDSSLN